MIVRTGFIRKGIAFIIGEPVGMASKKIFTPVSHAEIFERLVCD